MCFIPLHKVEKHKECNRCIIQVELKLNDFTLLDAYTLLTRLVGVCVVILQCVCAASSLEVKIANGFLYPLCIHPLNKTDSKT